MRLAILEPRTDLAGGVVVPTLFGLLVSTKTANDKNANMVGSTANKLLLKLKLAVAWASFDFVRLSERLLPIRVLSLLLWPLAAAWDLVQVRQRKPLTHWRHFPRSWRPKRWRFVLRQSLGLYHSQLFYMWPDRLSDARWMSRCRLEGGSELIGTREGDREWSWLLYISGRSRSCPIGCGRTALSRPACARPPPIR